MHERDPESVKLARAIQDGVRDADAAAAAEPEPLIEARAVSAIRDPLPAPVLSLDGRGAVLAEGGAAVLAGEGGTGKSALLYGLALDVAAADPDPDVASPAGPLRIHGGGPVLLTGYEDSAGLVAWAIREYGANAGTDPAALGRVHALDLDGRPLFGPVDRDGRAGLYNARPGKLGGWRHLAAAVEAIRPRLVVVDPALAAYVGDPSAVAPVREFLSALREFGAPVLLVAHSTKAARNDADPFDPGMVAGSGAWTDGVRGVLTLSWGEIEGARVLACPKANHGPARLLCGLAPVRKGGDPHGRILAFQRAPGGKGWYAPTRKPKANARAAKPGGAGKGAAGGTVAPGTVGP